MMQRIFNAKNLVAFILAAATGMTLYFRVPFPEGNIFLRVMALRSPSAFEVLKYSYSLFLFSTPYIGYSVVFSGLYIFALKAKQRIRAGKLPLFPDPRKRNDLFLVVGEVHNPRKQVPAERPEWLVIPERGLFTGVAILGAIGSGKTSCCMYPFAEQILAYRAGDTESRIGGLVLEVKGETSAAELVAVLTTAPQTSMTLRITPATRSKKREPLSTRTGVMFNLSRKPQVIPLRSGVRQRANALEGTSFQSNKAR